MKKIKECFTCDCYTLNLKEETCTNCGGVLLEKGVTKEEYEMMEKIEKEAEKF